VGNKKLYGDELQVVSNGMSSDLEKYWNAEGRKKGKDEK